MLCQPAIRHLRELCDSEANAPPIYAVGGQIHSAIICRTAPLAPHQPEISHHRRCDGSDAGGAASRSADRPFIEHLYLGGTIATLRDVMCWHPHARHTRIIESNIGRRQRYFAPEADDAYAGMPIGMHKTLTTAIASPRRHYRGQAGIAGEGR